MPYPLYMKRQQILKEKEQGKMEEVSGHGPAVSSCGAFQLLVLTSS